MTLTYSHRVMTETDKILASLPKVIHTAYRNKKTGSYILTLVITQSFSDAVKLMAERVKELMLTETDIFIDEKR